MTTQSENAAKPARAGKEEKRRRILEAGRIVLSEEGYSELSLRKVASKVGIHLKTLQHYFPTKEELIQSVVEYTDSLYQTTLEQLKLTSNDPIKHFKAYINYLLLDDKDEQTAGFFYQLWARAYKDEHAKGIMQKMYGHHIETISALMKPLNPKMSTQKRKERAYIIASILDGAMLHIGYGKERPEGIDNFEKEIITLAINLATNS